MECPFCAEFVKQEAIVCRHCSRDLRLVKPVIAEIQTTLTEIERLRRDLDKARLRLALRTPGRFLAYYGALYLLLPAALLIAAHGIIIYLLDLPALHLRLACTLIPLPFGAALFGIQRAGFRWALIWGALTALLAVAGMDGVVSLTDGVPFFPRTMRDWKEVVEFLASIMLAYGAGNILAIGLFRLLPSRITLVGTPGAVAHAIARMTTSYAGAETVRRRARRIQALMTTVMPLIGFVSTFGASLYAGLKGLIGN